MTMSPTAPLKVLMPRHFKPRLLVGRYRSKSEERVAGHLNELGVAYQYEPKDQKVPYEVQRTYLPDFVLTNSGVILEVKGHLTSEDRSKYIRIKATHPSIDIRFVFDRATNKLNKNSKTTYAEWATKHGFLWCEKIIPPNWIESKHARASSKAAGTPYSPSPRKGLHLTHGSTHRPRHLSTRRKHPRTA